MLLGLLVCTTQCRQVLGIDEPEPEHEGDRQALRLWTVSVATPTRVTLKNPSSGGVDLGDLTLRYDDPGPQDVPTACEARLPEQRLPAFGSVRVHESPLAGDLDGLAGTCETITLHVERGGRLYLCDGSCAAGRVIDMVAYVGTGPNRWKDPTEAQYGTSFTDPLAGIDDGVAEAVRYQRVATDAVAPNYVSSDWAVQRRTLFADFENGMTVSISNGPLVPWTMIPEEHLDLSVPGDFAYSGTSSLRIEHGGADAPTSTLTEDLSALSRPHAVSYFVHTDSATASAGYVDLCFAGMPVVSLGFEGSGLGAELANGSRVEMPFDVGTWYQVELRDIDWSEHHFDLYVDRRRVGYRIPFRVAADEVDQIRIYSVTGPSKVHLDDLELWGE